MCVCVCVCVRGVQGNLYLDTLARERGVQAGLLLKEKVSEENCMHICTLLQPPRWKCNVRCVPL